MSRRIWWGVSVTWLVAVLLLNLSWAVRCTFSRDENLTLAGGQLISQGNLPYRDFLYIHQPYQALALGALFRLTDYPLLAGRVFSALCATGTAMLVFLLAWDVLREQDVKLRFGLAWVSILFLVANPLYGYTSGLAWNHPVATLLMLLSVSLLICGLRRLCWRPWLLGSGMVLGLAIGARVSAVTIVLPCLGMFFFSGGEKLRRMLIWGSGLGFALLPSGIFFLLAPQAYRFGNITYHGLSSVYWRTIDPMAPYSLSQRLAYFVTDVLTQPANLLLLLLLFFFGGLALWMALQTRRWGFSELLFWLALLPFVVIGSLLASPARYQYFSPILPFALVGLVCSLAVVLGRAVPNVKTMHAWLYVLCVLIAFGYQAIEFKRVTFLLHPTAWRPLAFHGLGQKIDGLAPEGKILTLTPQFVVEAGRPIYPQFAASPFAWRVTPQLDPATRAALDLPASDELDSFLAADPPAGILVGIEGALDEPLIAYARQHGYSETPLNRDLSLWVQTNP